MSLIFGKSCRITLWNAFYENLTTNMVCIVSTMFGLVSAEKKNPLAVVFFFGASWLKLVSYKMCHIMVNSASWDWRVS